MIIFLKTILPILFGNIALGIIFAIMNFILIPFLAAKIPSLAGSTFFIGMGIAAFLTPILGNISDRIGKRGILIVSLFVGNVLSCIGISVLTGLSLFSCSVLFVVTAFALQPLYSAFVADHSSPEIRAKLYGVTMGTTTIACFLASLAIKAIFDVSPMKAFRILAFIILGLTALLGAGALREKGSKELLRYRRTHSCQRIFSSMLKDPHLHRLFISQVGAWFAIGGTLPLLTSFLRDTAELSVGNASLFAGFLSFLSGCAALGTGCLVKYFRQERFYFYICILLTVFLSALAGITQASLAGVTKRIVIIMLLCFMHLVIGMFYPLGPTILSMLAPSEVHGEAFGINNACIIISQGAAVQLFTLLSMQTGFSTVFSLAAVGSVLAAIFAKQASAKSI